MQLPKVIYVMGPPGSGKGTQSSLLAPKINYHQFSTGDAFRTVIRQDSELGRRLKEVVNSGHLAPPELAAEIVISAVAKHLEAGQGVIFDGTPRTMEEADLIDEYFLENDYGRPLVIALDENKEEMIRRNTKRIFCLDIEGSFPIVTPEEEKKCLSLGGRVGRRPDDDPAKLETRWQEYTERTLPAIQKYRKEGLTIEINGMQTIEKVHEDIMNALGSWTY